MPGSKPNMSPMTWILISGIGFVFFFGMAVLFGVYNDRLNLVKSSAYFFLLVPLGLIAAGFLFGALRSHAKYSGKAYGGTVELGGPVVVLALIILLGYQFRPAENSFTATVNVFGGSQSLENGSLTAYYGTAHISKKISEGQVVLNEIPQEFRGQEITFVPHVDGYAADSQKKIIPVNNTSIDVYLKKTAEEVMVSGNVHTKKGDPVRSALVSFADGLATDTTDKLGNFRLILPFKDGSETRLRIYVGDKLKYNMLQTLSAQVSLNISID